MRPSTGPRCGVDVRGSMDRDRNPAAQKVGAVSSPSREGTAHDRPPASSTVAVLAFDLAGRRYGLPVEQVVQIVEIVKISRLPVAPPFVLGLVNYRGQVIPLIDMRRRFKLPLQPYTLRTPIVISNLDGSQVGLVVDKVSDVVELRPEQFFPPEENATGEIALQRRFLSAVAYLGDDLLLLLDPSALLSLEEYDRAAAEPGASGKEAVS